MSSFVSDLVLCSLGGEERYPLYARALREACARATPAFGTKLFGDEYRRLACNPSWFASLIASNADLEGYSAKQLWSYANAIAEGPLCEGLRKHALDEARHSKMFSSLLFLAFPNVESPELRSRLSLLTPDLKIQQPLPNIHQERPTSEILNSLVLMNLHEIKALVLEYLLQPTLIAYAALSNRKAIRRLMERLIRDEVEHIRYTAAFMEEKARQGHLDDIVDLMSDFLEILNAVTDDELVESRRKCFIIPSQGSDSPPELPVSLS